MIMTMKHHGFRGGDDIKDGGFALEQMIERNKTIFDKRLTSSIKQHPPGYPPLRMDGLGFRRPS